MEREGLTEEEAFTALRIHSQRTGLSLRARAEEITGSTRDTVPGVRSAGRRGPPVAEEPAGPLRPHSGGTPV